MAEQTKQALKVENNTNFPNNNTGFITPALLREFNTDMIDSTVNQIAYTADSASATISINALNAFTSSVTATATGSLLTTASFSGNTMTFTKGDGSTFGVVIPDVSGSTTTALNEATASLQAFTASVAGTNAFTQSAQLEINSLEAFTSSVAGTNAFTASIAGTNAFTQSAQLEINALEAFTASVAGTNVFTASMNTYTASTNARLNSIEATTASLQNQINLISGSGVAIAVDALNLFTASIQQTNAFTQSAQVSINALNAETSSYAKLNVNNQFTTSQTITGSLVVTGDITANKLNVIIESSSVIFSSGSNIFGDEITDVQTLNGQVVVTNALTASGLIYPTADNGEKSFIQTDGNGNLSLQYVDTIFEAFYAGESVPKGTPLYLSGSVGANPIARAADASNPNKMPVTLIANENLTADNTYEGIVLGLIEGIDLTGFTAGQTVYVAEGGGYSTSLPSGSNSITQVLGVITKGGSGGKGLVLNPGPAQLPGLQTGYVWVGNASNQPIAVATSSFASLTDLGPLNAFSASTNLFTASIAGTNAFTQSIDGRVNGLEAATASYATTGSNDFNGQQRIAAGFGLVTDKIVPDAARQALQIETYFGIGEVGITGSLNISNSLTASLSEGYVWVGGAGDKTELVATSSFAGTPVDISALNNFTASVAGTNAFTQSADQRLDSIEAQSGSWVTSAITASSVQSISSTLASLQFDYVKGDGTSQTVTLVGPAGTDLTALNEFTASIAGTNAFTASATLRLNSLESTSGSYATTGSNTFVGNQFITGALQVSSAAIYDIDVTGSIQATTSMRVTGSTGIGLLQNNLLSITSGSYSSVINRGAIINQLSLAGNQKYISIAADPSSLGPIFPTLAGVTSPSIISQGPAGTSFYAPIRLQSSASYTDGRVTITTPLEALSGSIISGSTQLVGTATLNGNALVTSAETASLLITASFSGNTLTFTKGDSTTFGVIIPDVSGSGTINTGSFATTGSNSFIGNQTISGSVGISGSAITFVSGTLSGSVVTNIGDTFTDVAPVNRIITLTSASYAALVTGSSTDPNALYIVSGSTSGSITGAGLNGNTFSGSQVITGSVQGNVVAMSIASNTASMDFNAGNFFTLTLESGSIPTFINPTNIKAGQTISLVVTQAATLSGSLAFPTTFKFPSGSSYVPSAVTSSKDIVTFITVDTSTIFASAVKNLI